MNGHFSLLLIDDEEGIRKVLGLTLADAGWNVSPAASAEEALGLFRQHDFPIVLTDIKMPGMDGLELLKVLKEIKPETEVVLMTGHGDLDLAIQGIKLDAADFVTKPIHDDALDIALARPESAGPCAGPSVSTRTTSRIWSSRRRASSWPPRGWRP